MSEFISVTDATFSAIVLESAKPVVVEFCAQWCTQCPRVEKILLGVADTDLGEEFTLVKADLDDASKVAQIYGVQSVPAVIIFDHGMQAAQLFSIRSAGQVRVAIEEVLRPRGANRDGRLG